ncbi:MAG TPA: aminotransferase class III-fold pyridoxal phosphate-dependent enzyme [Chitinophagales bacterium]|nr:aminotransferase class III-fold pyridoxal phosphate-dependent enzyme [Chitinophagales bacterium]
MGKGQELYIKAKKLIPGGTQLLSKRPEMFLPDQWPAYYKKSLGCEVWDLDDKKYIDMSYMGVGACTIGYADEDVNAAVENVVKNGNMCTLNAPEEVELAELLIQLHPWADMVRYTRSGGEAMAVAVRIARAATKKDIVLFSGYHGWHDWYLSANITDEKALDGKLISGLAPSGIPRDLKNTAFPFYYNNKQQFLDLINTHGDKIGAVVAETIRNIQPEPGFFELLIEETKKRNIPLIFDEVSSGFRTNTGGAHMLMDIEPDIAVFAKGMSNGYAMGAVIGKEWVMDAAQNSFISSTYWTERIGPAAAIASIKKMLKYNVQEHMIKVGKMVLDGWNQLSEKHGLNIHTNSFYPLGHFDFPENNIELKTLYTQEMLKKGFLATNAFYASYSHKEEHVIAYLEATDEVFATIAKAISEGNIEKYLEGPVCQTGFKRLT